MPKLSVKINNVFDGDDEVPEMVRAAARAGADAVGFRPWYDDLDAIADATASADIDIAYLSGGSPATDGPGFPMADPAASETAIETITNAIDAAASVDAAFVNVIPGQRSDTLDPAVQHAAIVHVLRHVADRAERTGVTLALEPVNTAVDHPGSYLTTSHEGYEIVDAVDSPNVTLLYDVYHQQITEGNIIQTLRAHVDQIGYVHVGDVPGRHEPGTGEINYPNVLSALVETGYDGYVGCEFEPIGEPVTAIRAVGSMLERDGNNPTPSAGPATELADDRSDAGPNDET